MSVYYIEKEGGVVSTDDVEEWSLAMENKTVVKTKVGDLIVSTVFLGLDHGFGGGPPVLWETMIYRKSERDGSIDWDLRDGGEYQWRYSSKQEAFRHHEEVVKWVEDGMKGDPPEED